MTDEVANESVVDEVSTTGTSETSTAVVDESAIREQVRAELESKWEKERQGLQTGIAEERRKRQEAEAKRANPNASQPDIDAIVDAKFREREEAEQRRRADESLSQTKQTFHERKAEAAKKHEGVNLDEAAYAVGEALKASTDLQMQLMQAENSWDLIAHLSQQPETLKKLSQLSPVAAGIELGRIEANMGKRRSVTNAPDPISPVTGGYSDVDDIYELEGDRFESALKERNGGSVFPR